MPVHLVPGEELQIHASVARGLDVRPLLRGPVLIMANGEEDAVFEQVCTEPVGVDAAEVGDVVAVLLEKSHGGIFIAKVEVAGGYSVTCGEWAIVADLVGASVCASPVEVGAAVSVVGLPGWIGGLEQYVGLPRDVPHNEGDVALPAGVGPGQQGQIHTGHRRSRHIP